MAIVFATRGSFTARYSNGGATAASLGNTAPTATNDTSALSGNSIQWAANNNAKAVVWNGALNTPSNRTTSMLVRYRPSYALTPAVTRQLFSLTGGAARLVTWEVQHNTTNNITFYARNETAAVCMNFTVGGNWTATQNQWYDLLFVWGGNTTANTCVMYVDAAQVASASATQAWSTTWNNRMIREICLGTGFNNGILNADRIDEVVIWDTAIDPTAVTLESGSGSLNGTARTSLVNVSAFDGQLSSNPGATNVNLNTTYAIAGVNYTGSYVATSGGIGSLGMPFMG